MNARPPLYRVVTWFYTDGSNDAPWLEIGLWMDQIGPATERMELSCRIDAAMGISCDRWLELV